jgi:hypothetical protein
VVKSSVESLDTGHSDVDLLGELQGRAKICLDLHGTLGLEVHPHCAVGLLRLCHRADRLLLEISGESAFLGVGKHDELVEHASDHGTNSNLLKELCVVCCFEEHAGRVKSNRTVAYQ